ncbi:MAG TPA: hypothetical protein VF477_04985, partial [Mycobacterium sp.]
LAMPTTERTATAVPVSFTSASSTLLIWLVSITDYHATALMGIGSEAREIIYRGASFVTVQKQGAYWPVC